MAVSTRGVARRSSRLIAAKEKLEAVQAQPAVRASVNRKNAKPVSNKKTAAKKKKAPATRRSKAPTEASSSTTHGTIYTPTPAKTEKKSGLKGTVDTQAPLGVVDPASGLKGTILSVGDETADAMLVLIDASKNSDKYFVLQCIHLEGNNNFVVYSRWGRTGTAGQSMQQTFRTAAKARIAFREKFRQKTGLTWDNRLDTPVTNKYRFIVQDFDQKRSGWSNGLWQYYVDDGVDGKRVGWYDYTPQGSQGVEMLFHQNAQNSRLTSRHVSSGIFTYNVDLANMTQTNVTHAAHTTRRIRRVPAEGTTTTTTSSLSTVQEPIPPTTTTASAAPSTPTRRSKRSQNAVTPSP